MSFGHDKKKMTAEEIQLRRDEYVNICINNHITGFEDSINHTTGFEDDVDRVTGANKNSSHATGLKEVAKRAELLKKEPENEVLQKEFFEYISSAGKKEKEAFPDQIKTLSVYLEYKFACSNMNEKVRIRLEKEIDKQIGFRQVLLNTDVVRKGAGKGGADVTQDLSDALSSELNILKGSIEVFNSLQKDNESEESGKLKKSAAVYAKKLNALKKNADNKAFTNIPRKLSEADANRTVFINNLSSYIVKKKEDYKDDPAKLKADEGYLAALRLSKVNADYKKAVISYARDSILAQAQADGIKTDVIKANYDKTAESVKKFSDKTAEQLEEMEKLEQERLEQERLELERLEQEKEAQRIYELHVLLSMNKNKNQYEMQDILLEFIDELRQGIKETKEEVKKMINEEDYQLKIEKTKNEETEKISEKEESKKDPAKHPAKKPGKDPKKDSPAVPERMIEPPVRMR